MNRDPQSNAGYRLRGFEGLDPQHAQTLQKTLFRMGLTIEPMTPETDEAVVASDISRRPVEPYSPPQLGPQAEDFAVTEADVIRSMEARPEFETLNSTRLIIHLSRYGYNLQEKVRYRDEATDRMVLSLNWLRSLIDTSEGQSKVQMGWVPGIGQKSAKLLEAVLADKAADIEHAQESSTTNK